jgi:hypothetical protein
MDTNIFQPQKGAAGEKLKVESRSKIEDGRYQTADGRW